jgi:hypothetical protein
MGAGVSLPAFCTKLQPIRKGESYESYVHSRHSDSFSDHWHGAQ